MKSMLQHRKEKVHSCVYSPTGCIFHVMMRTMYNSDLSLFFICESGGLGTVIVLLWGKGGTINILTPLDFYFYFFFSHFFPFFLLFNFFLDIQSKSGTSGISLRLRIQILKFSFRLCYLIAMLTQPFHSQNVTVALRNFINRKGLREYSLSIFSVTLPFFRSTMKKTIIEIQKRCGQISHIRLSLLACYYSTSLMEKILKRF